MSPLRYDSCCRWEVAYIDTSVLPAKYLPFSVMAFGYVLRALGASSYRAGENLQGSSVYGHRRLRTGKQTVLVFQLRVRRCR